MITSAAWRLSLAELDLEEKLGSFNSNGEVWKGRYKGIPVVIKQLFTLSSDVEEDTLLPLSSLSHPNLAQTLGICCFKGEDVYVVSEYIAGRNLDVVLHDKSVPIDMGVKIEFAKALISTLMYLNFKNVLHRCFTTHHIWISPDLKLKVIDYGLVRPEKDHYSWLCIPPIPFVTDTVKTRYSVDVYMPPESCKGIYDVKSEVYSFGIVLYEIITRNKPNAVVDVDKFMFDESKAELTIPEGTPEDIWKLICDCCKENPNERPSYDSILERLEEVAKGLAVHGAEA
eukprot:TRINITY_DN9807_c0_g5_i1.p1 TRINITY_DN9807_c0_g5~~TRINITY_DN9807_c0_g5_i1.p1  ORF type:complete len:285 (-),score=41.06 TRINITY_DN9807_c0_g5_i1:82-936(-)